MTEEELLQIEVRLKAEKEFFESNKENIESIGKLRKDSDKIENICISLNFINAYLNDGLEMRYAEKENRSIQSESIQTIIKVMKELEERITKLENQ